MIDVSTIGLLPSIEAQYLTDPRQLWVNTGERKSTQRSRPTSKKMRNYGSVKYIIVRIYL